MYRQDMKNFVKQISIKFRGFYFIKMNLVQNVLYRQAQQNISVEVRISSDIQNVKYRPVISVDRYISRSLVQKFYARPQVQQLD